MSCFKLILLGTCLTIVAGQFPPQPEDVTVLKSRFHKDVTISYKEPGICETTPGVRSYSGYIHLPPHALTEAGEAQTYPINTFFWFFESRKDPHNAPLSIWLNGGPGGSSLIGALLENGPCFVGRDSNSTFINEWSWNNEVNMLYIDQPNQVGYSYDVLTNITADLIGGEGMGPASVITVTDFSEGVPQQNETFLVGTSFSQNSSNTANTTNHAAVAMWHFAQTWFEEFPAYKPHDERISLASESYGGTYGPAFMEYFERQNELIANGTITTPGVHYLHLDTLVIVNGCIDSELQGRSNVEIAWNNTYGIKAINESAYHAGMWESMRPGGIEDQIRECGKLVKETDPNNSGAIEHVNGVCRNASAGEYLLSEAYRESGKHGWFDITHPWPDSFPSFTAIGFLNQHWVQKALGVAVNFTVESVPVSEIFGLTGDMTRGGQMQQLAYLLESGVKVHMMYGDRDYACNWMGGEVVSKVIPYNGREAFNSAGYETLVTNPFYSGGRTRQYGNLSFTRVFQAGHMVPSYQQETAYRIFVRALFNKDISSGTVDLSDDYASKGPSSTWDHLNDVLPAPEPECYTLMTMACTEEQKKWLKEGSAIIKDYYVVGRNASRPLEAEYVWIQQPHQEVLENGAEKAPADMEL